MICQTWDIGNLRPAAGGDQKMTGGDLAAVDGNTTRAGYGAPPLDQLHPGIAKKRPVDPFQPVQLGIF